MHEGSARTQLINNEHRVVLIISFCLSLKNWQKSSVWPFTEQFYYRITSSLEIRATQTWHFEWEGLILFGAILPTGKPGEKYTGSLYSRVSKLVTQKTLARPAQTFLPTLHCRKATNPFQLTELYYFAALLASRAHRLTLSLSSSSSSGCVNPEGWVQKGSRGAKTSPPAAGIVGMGGVTFVFEIGKWEKRK